MISVSLFSELEIKTLSNSKLFKNFLTMKLLTITISEAFRFFGSSTSSNQCLVIILQFHFRSHTDGGRDQYHHSHDRVRRTKTRGGP